MNTPQTLTALTATFLLAACSSPSGMTIQQYSSLSRDAGKLPAKLSIQMTVQEPGASATEFPKQKVAEGKSIRIAAQRDFVYPASYRPAVSSLGRSALTPATPQEFRTVKTGIETDLRCKREGSVFIIKGSISVTDFQGFSRMGGAYGQPILDDKGRLLTENRIEMPKLATFTTPVYLAIKSGDSTTFQISHPHKGTSATIHLIPEN